MLPLVFLLTISIMMMVVVQCSRLCHQNCDVGGLCRDCGYCDLGSASGHGGSCCCVVYVCCVSCSNSGWGESGCCNDCESGSCFILYRNISVIGDDGHDDNDDDGDNKCRPKVVTVVAVMLP